MPTSRNCPAFAAWALSVAACCLPPLPAPADEPAPAVQLRQSLAELLEVGWGKSLGASALARQKYESARHLAPGDQRPAYALLLVEIKHRAYDRAAETARGITDADPRHLGAWQARVWLSMLTRKYPQALAEIEAFSPLLADAVAPGSDEQPYHEAARFLGCMFAYLAGPAEGAIPPARLDDARHRLLQRLAASRTESFEVAYRQLQTQYQDLRLALDETRFDAQAQQQAQQELDRQRLAAERDAVASEKAAVDQQAQQARAAAEAQLAALDEQLAPLDARLAAVNVRATQLQARVLQLTADVNYLLARAAETDDPLERTALLASADRIGISLRLAEGELRLVQTEAAQLAAQRAALLDRRRRVIADYEAQGRRLGVDAARLRRTEDRIVRQQQDNLRPVNPNTPRVRSTSSTVTALTTYYPFPLEQEKLRLLASLR